MTTKLILDIDEIEKNYTSKKLNIMKIKGAFGKAPKKFDWKKIKIQYLLEKYIK